jgi:hypothetical protein
MSMRVPTEASVRMLVVAVLSGTSQPSGPHTSPCRVMSSIA